MTFEFASAGRILVGEGSVRQVPGIVREWGRRFLLVTGRSVGRARPLVVSMESAGLELRVVSVGSEPTVEDAVRGAAVAREQRVDGVIGLGGGSALDAAKAMAALASNPGDPLRYLEVIGEGRPLENLPLPFVAVPTTAGTGTEVTRNAVLTSPAHRVKVSLRNAGMLARLAVVDPELTYGMSSAVTAATGLDALTQLIEPFVSCRANPMTDGLCREGIVRAARSLRAACASAGRWAGENGALELAERERLARADMAVAALFSGLALANAGLGAVHGFAGPIGGMFPAPHGAVCAALLPGAMETNLRALDARAPGCAARRRFDEIARLVTGRSDAAAADGVAWVRALCADLKVPGLGQYGIARDHVPALVEKASVASSMKGNPIPLTAAELADMLAGAI